MRAATRGSEICSRGFWITRAHRSRSYGRRRSTRLLHSPITSASTTRSRQERSRRLQQQPSRTSTTNVRSCCARSSRRKPCGNRLSFVLRRERERKQVEPAFAQPARLYITSICSEQSGGSHVTRVGGHDLLLPLTLSELDASFAQLSYPYSRRLYRIFRLYCF